MLTRNIQHTGDDAHSEHERAALRLQDARALAGEVADRLSAIRCGVRARDEPTDRGFALQVDDAIRVVESLLETQRDAAAAEAERHRAIGAAQRRRLAIVVQTSQPTCPRVNAGGPWLALDLVRSVVRYKNLNGPPCSHEKMLAIAVIGLRTDAHGMVDDLGPRLVDLEQLRVAIGRSPRINRTDIDGSRFLAVTSARGARSDGVLEIELCTEALLQAPAATEGDHG